MECLADNGGRPSGAFESNQTLYDEFVRLCQMADSAGFSTIWTGEHHGMGFTVTPNPFLPLIDLAHKTKCVRLGTGAIVAPFWHPIRLAGEAAMADLIMDGRLELGLARGAYSFEYDRVGNGIDAQGASERLREMVPALRGLWAGDYAHDGKHWQFPQTTAMPRPVNGSGPPLWIAARDPASFAFAMSQDCNIQVTPLWQGDEEVEALAQKFAAALTSCRPARRPQLMLLRHLFVGESEAELAHGAEALSAFFCNFSAWFQNKRPVSQGHIKPLSTDEMAGMEMFAPKKMRRNLVVGTPGQVIDRLRRYEALGFDEFSLWLDSGMPFHAKRRSLELFTREVMPAFKEEAELV
jgi:alkanesulfonate monooxygenase SsuD/methylene tetrahydromethanopterin reductase-like flavin-dependent oxidoreductase (luciferase family)